MQFGAHTQMGWEVEDIEATMRELRMRGVEFQEYDLPGLKTVDGIAEIKGNYASKVLVSEARGSATAKVTCWESGSRFDPDGRPVASACGRYCCKSPFEVANENS